MSTAADDIEDSVARRVNQPPISDALWAATKRNYPHVYAEWITKARGYIRALEAAGYTLRPAVKEGDRERARKIAFRWFDMLGNKYCEDLAQAIATALSEARMEGQSTVKARDALLNLRADAQEFTEDVDGDEVNGCAVSWCYYHIRIGERELRELCTAVGIKVAYDESPLDAIDREIEAEASTPPSEEQGR